MTQREKLIKARMLALRMKSISKGLEYDAEDYGVNFPLQYARELKEQADDFLKLK